MSQTRRIKGEIIFPVDAGAGVASQITVELRDVSMQDAVSTVVASKTIDRVKIGPNLRMPFELSAPASAKNRSLSMRVQVSMKANSQSATGDFLSTVATPVATDGDVHSISVPVSKL